MSFLKGLIIDTPHIDNILSGRKTWEMRSTGTKQRGLVALIRKGSGSVIGVADIENCLGPLGKDEMLANLAKHLIARNRIESGAVAKWNHAWVMANARALARPVAYRHPSGAVIWVNLDSRAAESVLQQGTRSSGH